MEARTQILETIQRYMTALFVEHNQEKAGEFLTEEIIHCDLNTTKFLASKQAVMHNINDKLDKSVENRSISIEHAQINVYDQMAVFMGRIVIDRTGNSKGKGDALQYSATLIKQDRWKICASHYSIETDEDNDTSDVFGFTVGNIAGGLLSAYVEDDCFPYRSINENLLNLLEYTKEEFLATYGNDVMEIVHPDDRAAAIQKVSYCIEQGNDWRLNHRTITKSGKILHMLVRGRKSLDAVGREIVTNFSIDMTDMYMLQEEVAIQAEELEAQNEELLDQTAKLSKKTRELALSDQKFRIALAKTNHTIFDYHIVEDTVLCYNLKESNKDRRIPVTRLEKELLEQEVICQQDQKAFRDIFQKVKKGDMFVAQDIQTLALNGEKKWYEFLVTAVFDSAGEPVYAIGTVEDITKQKREAIELKYKAEFDLLTEVYNKSATMEKIEEQLGTHESIKSGILIIIDIDAFKTVNDVYGHPCGDQILKAVAKVLKNNFRETDIIGRLGGDEFFIYAEGAKNIYQIKQKVDNINREVRQIAHPGGEGDKITVSIGVTTCNGVQKSFEQIYKEADKALYNAKRMGKDTFCFFDSGNPDF